MRTAQSVAARASGNADYLVDQFQQEAAVVRAVGMRPQAFAQWHEMALQGLRSQIEASDVSGGFTALSKALRLFLQSAMLGLGAYLVLQNQMTAGAMIASSILLGRALAPIDMLLGQWSQVQDALKSGRNLAALLEVVPAERARMALPRPAAKIVAKDLHVVPPGTKKASLRGVSFEVRPGQVLGVIGSSGSGKSSLAQALTGLWPPAAGTLSFDQAGFAQYGADDLASYVGYLPQRVPLFGGTIAQNIARLAAFPDEGAVIRAAKAAGAHDMILALPEGYDTALSYGRAPLSGGQVQQIGLARALYADLVMVVLDEPNAALDHDAILVLNRAISRLKTDGCAVFVMAHRPSAIEVCDLLLILDQGAPVAFGPKEEVLRDTVINHRDFKPVPRRAGGRG